ASPRACPFSSVIQSVASTNLGFARDDRNRTAYQAVLQLQGLAKQIGRLCSKDPIAERERRNPSDAHTLGNTESQCHEPPRAGSRRNGRITARTVEVQDNTYLAISDLACVYDHACPLRQVTAKEDIRIEICTRDVADLQQAWVEMDSKLRDSLATRKIG